MSRPISEVSEPDYLRYLLSRHLPDMERGCVVHTNYGDIDLDSDLAREVAGLVEKRIRQRLCQLERESRA